MNRVLGAIVVLALAAPFVTHAVCLLDCVPSTEDVSCHDPRPVSAEITAGHDCGDHGSTVQLAPAVATASPVILIPLVHAPAGAALSSIALPIDGSESPPGSPIRRTVLRI